MVVSQSAVRAGRSLYLLLGFGGSLLRRLPVRMWYVGFFEQRLGFGDQFRMFRRQIVFLADVFG